LKVKRGIVIALSLIVFLFTVTSATYAEFYKLNITRIDQDLYKETNSGYYIRTKYCYEYAHYEDVIYNSNTQELIFEDGSTYEVVGIFK